MAALKKAHIIGTILICFICFNHPWSIFSASVAESTLLKRIETLEIRLVKLEQQLQNEIRTKKLVVLNQKGQEIISLQEEKLGGNFYPTMKMYNNDNKVSVKIDGSPMLFLGLNGIEKYSFVSVSSYIPSRTEWNLLKFVTENSNQRYLTDNLILTSVTANVDYDTTVEKFETLLLITVNTAPQPSWENYYLSNGKFNLTDREIRGEYFEAGNYIVRTLNNYINSFEEFSHIIISFTIRGSEVGTWKDGVMKLKGE